MIKQAEIIAVVNISRVEPTKEKRSGWTYSEAALATVEQTVKGSLPKDVRLYGGEDFICAQVHYQPGRCLVFLRRDKELLAGVNWHLGVRAIKEDKIEWFADDKKLELKEILLSEVLTEIKKLVSEKK
ncbi:MAG: hypothetical protein ACR2H1_04175 [Limisphaerales bacterium]